MLSLAAIVAIQVVAPERGTEPADVEAVVHAAMQAADFTPEVKKPLREPVAGFDSAMTLLHEEYQRPTRVQTHHTWLSRACVVVQALGEDSMTMRAYLTSLEPLCGEVGVDAWVVDEVA